MIAGAHWLASKFGISDFVVSELGAAAGLNLMWDRFRLDLAWGVLGPRDSNVRLDPEWRGPPPPEGNVRIVDRRGVDIAPLDPRDPADRLKLTSYLWPDQPWRIERARAAGWQTIRYVDRDSFLEAVTQYLPGGHPTS